MLVPPPNTVQAQEEVVTVTDLSIVKKQEWDVYPSSASTPPAIHLPVGEEVEIGLPSLAHCSSCGVAQSRGRSPVLMLHEHSEALWSGCHTRGPLIIAAAKGRQISFV